MSHLEQPNLRRLVAGLTPALWLLARVSAADLPPAGDGRAPAAPPFAATPAESEYLVDFWATEEGLPNNTVSSLAQSPDGYLWCGTYDGVVRFDGVRFVRIGPDDATNQQANRIQCLLVDRRGQLWLGTDGAGVFRFADGAFKSFAAAPESSFNAVRCLAEDAAGDLWLGTRGGIGRLRDGRLAWFTDADGFTNAAKSTWNFVFDPEGGLWVADWNSLKVFRDGGFQSVLQRPAFRVPIRTVYADPDGQLWAGMMGQALRRQGDGQWVDADEAGQFNATEVTAFCRTRGGEFWVGTRKGLYRRRGGRWTPFMIRDGPVNSEVRTLFEDREGNLWVGTGTAGLARLKPRILQVFTARHGLTDGTVLAVREDPAGGLMVGLNDGRLLAGTGGRFERSAATRELPRDAPIKSLLFTRDGALWIGTFGNGLLRVDAARTLLFAPSIGSPARTDKITALLEDRAGTVWVGTFFGLYRAVRTNVLEPVLKDGRELRVPVTALLEDGAGDLLAACEGLGVLRLSAGRQTWLTRAEGLPTHFVRTLHEDTAGGLWIGTAAGLCCWRDGRLSTFTRAHGLVDDTVSQILEDDAGNLWLGSNGGIMRVPRREFLDVAAGQKSLLEVSVFGLGDGMLSAECAGGFGPAGVKTRDGRLWFPTVKGLVMLDPARLQRARNPVPPPVYIEEVRVDGEVVAQPHTTPRRSPERAAPPPALSLGAGVRRLEVHYTALSFTAPERVRFRHRLEGLDADWTEAGTARRVTYPKLPPGRYRFQVIACNHDGVWNETGHALAFRVASPFWRTGWFLGGAGLASAAGVGALIRGVSVRQLRRKLRRLEEAHAIEQERMRIAQDMHDQLGGKLSRISFLSDLARRNLPGEAEAAGPIDEVSEAARDVIRTVDEIVWAVSPRNDTLESLAHYICRHAEELFEVTSVELELELPAEFPAHRLSAEVRHNLFCAVKEALHNVFKHAHATQVRVAFRLLPSCLSVTITDNGRGFDAPAVLARIAPGGRPADATPRGDGLLNMRERLRSIRGRCELESRPGQGTRAVFSVPLA